MLLVPNQHTDTGSTSVKRNSLLKKHMLNQVQLIGIPTVADRLTGSDTNLWFFRYLLVVSGSII